MSDTKPKVPVWVNIKLSVKNRLARNKSQTNKIAQSIWSYQEIYIEKLSQYLSIKSYIHASH